MNLSELIRDHYDADPDVTARAVMDVAGVPLKWRQLFYGVVRDECRRMSRSVVRNHERFVDSEVSPWEPIDGPSPISVSAPTVQINQQAVYLADRMCIGADGTYVLKGDATANEWLMRADFLATLRDGMSRTIDDCVEVAKFLADAGADSLNDLVAVAA